MRAKKGLVVVESMLQAGTSELNARKWVSALLHKQLVILLAFQPTARDDGWFGRFRTVTFGVC